MEAAQIKKYQDVMMKHISEMKNQKLRRMCMKLIHDKNFIEAPAAKSETRHTHHSYYGGLLQHTAEVVDAAAAMCKSKLIPVNYDVVIAAAIWHDCGKIYDYHFEDEKTVKATDHYSYIRHLSRSYAEFLLKTKESKNILKEDLVMKISHCILAHHGRKEWGSPVEPETREAFIVHAADMLSAHAFKF